MRTHPSIQQNTRHCKAKKTNGNRNEAREGKRKHTHTCKLKNPNKTAYPPHPTLPPSVLFILLRFSLPVPHSVRVKMCFRRLSSFFPVLLVRCDPCRSPARGMRWAFVRFRFHPFLSALISSALLSVPLSLALLLSCAQPFDVCLSLIGVFRNCPPSVCACGVVWLGSSLGQTENVGYSVVVFAASFVALVSSPQPSSSPSRSSWTPLRVARVCLSAAVARNK